MRIGVDVASLAYKRLVERIVLVAGDADFVPAAKLARRDGIDFVLDSMHAHINSGLYEHTDGLVSVAPQPRSESNKGQPSKGHEIAFSQPYSTTWDGVERRGGTSFVPVLTSMTPASQSATPVDEAGKK